MIRIKRNIGAVRARALVALALAFVQLFGLAQLASAYDRRAAVAYIAEWWNRRNTDNFDSVPARSSQKMSCQIRLPAGSPTGYQSGVNVEVVTKAWADTIFANYQLGETP